MLRNSSLHKSIEDPGITQLRVARWFLVHFTIQMNVISFLTKSLSWRKLHKAFLVLSIPSYIASAKELPTAGVLLYREPSSDYVVAVRYFSLQPGRIDSQITLVGGSTIRVWNSSIVSRINVPPADISSTSIEDADATIRAAESLLSRFPDYKAQISWITDKWRQTRMALTARSASQKTRIDHRKLPSPDLTIEGVTYSACTLSAVTLEEASIEHASGVIKVPTRTLTPEQIRALNETSKTLRITLAPTAVTRVAPSPNQAATKVTPPPTATPAPIPLNRFVTPFEERRYAAVQDNGTILIADPYHLLRFTKNGALDSSFGVGGVVKTPIRCVFRDPCGIFTQTNGKVMIAGESFIPNWPFFVNGEWKKAPDSMTLASTLVRFESDGSPDASFGKGGVLVTLIPPVDGSGTPIEWGRCTVVQKDGKFIVGGTPRTDNAILLRRFDSEGKPDVSFGRDGKAVEILQDNTSVSDIMGLATSPDGKIVVAVKALISSGTPEERAIAWKGSLSLDPVIREYASKEYGKLVRREHLLVRFNHDGSVDPSYGQGGRVSIGSDIGPNRDIHRLLLQPDGRVVIVAGDEFSEPLPTRPLKFLGYDSFGALDSRFRTGLPTAGDRVCEWIGTSASVRHDGVIAIAGRLKGGGTLALALFRPDGSAFRDFANNGVATIALGGLPYPEDIVFQKDGCILIVGALDKLYPSDDVFQKERWAYFLSRLDGSGQQDPSFGVQGKAIFNIDSTPSNP